MARFWAGLKVFTVDLWWPSIMVTYYTIYYCVSNDQHFDWPYVTLWILVGKLFNFTFPLTPISGPGFVSAITTTKLWNRHYFQSLVHLCICVFRNNIVRIFHLVVVPRGDIVEYGSCCNATLERIGVTWHLGHRTCKDDRSWTEASSINAISGIYT